MKRFPIWIGNVLCAAPVIALACTISTPAVAQTAEPTALRTDTIYETNYQTGAVELYSARGKDLGAVGRLSFPTGLTFDKVGNLYVSSDVPGDYSIQKIAPNGTVTVFADTGLSGPHALAFDKNSNLYVANVDANTVRKFTPAGVGTVFADATDGLKGPIDLVFDGAGNLYVSNAFGGPTLSGFRQGPVSGGATDQALDLSPWRGRVGRERSRLRCACDRNRRAGHRTARTGGGRSRAASHRE